MSFDGKRVVVIGGTSGIGRAVADLVKTQGATVVVASGSSEKVEKAKAAGADARQVNVRDEAQVSAFFEKLGAFDHLVYTAGDWGTRGAGAIEALDLAQSADGFAVRFWGAIACVKHACRTISPKGSITLTNGMIAHRPRKGAAVSSAMAGSIENLTRALAIELAPIRVNIVCPGYIETDIWASIPADQRAERLKKMTERFPLLRAGQPNEAAEAYLYLIRGSYTTGQVLVVDGGMSVV